MLERLTYELLEVDGARFYSFDGESYPSVTTILGATKDEKGLVAWRKRVGEEEANRVSEAALERGTALHQSIQDTLEGTKDSAGNEYYQSWLKWFRSTKPVPALIEGPVWSEAGYAGTVDFVAQEGDGLVVYDWKTADRPRQERYVVDYKLQVSAYAKAVSERYEIPVTRCVVLVCLPDTTQEFVVNPEVYYDGFIERLNAYYWD